MNSKFSRFLFDNSGLFGSQEPARCGLDDLLEASMELENKACVGGEKLPNSVICRRKATSMVLIIEDRELGLGCISWSGCCCSWATAGLMKAVLSWTGIELALDNEFDNSCGMDRLPGSRSVAA